MDRRHDARPRRTLRPVGTGWRWPLGGGPISAWCRPRDSITKLATTVDRVIEALCEWRGWLEDLVGWFDGYPLDLDVVDDDGALWAASCGG